MLTDPEAGIEVRLDAAPLKPIAAASGPAASAILGSTTSLGSASVSSKETDSARGRLKWAVLVDRLKPAGKNTTAAPLGFVALAPIPAAAAVAFGGWTDCAEATFSARTAGCAEARKTCGVFVAAAAADVAGEAADAAVSAEYVLVTLDLIGIMG